MEFEKPGHTFVDRIGIIPDQQPGEKENFKKKLDEHVSPADLKKGINGIAERLQMRLDAMKGSQAESTTERPAWQRIYKVNLPDIVTFANKWIGQPLFPGPQTDFAVAMFGTDPLLWRGGSKYIEAYEKWGKGGGKDTTLAVIFDYANAKLAAMWDPWAYFGKPPGDAIDIINVSYNAQQAREVFFKRLKAMMRKTRNPYTGRNLFEELGLDLREGGRNLQARKVILNDRKTTTGEDTICCHAGDSREITGEGKNVLLAMLDELGAFPSVEKVIELHDALLDTALTRFGDLAMLAAISYIYAKNDGMETLYTKAVDLEHGGTAHKTTFASWEVNPTIDMKIMAKMEIKNPRRFKRVYRCIVADEENQFFKPSEEVRGQCNTLRAAPIDGDLWWTDDVTVNLETKTCSIPFKEGFRGIPGVQYWIHYDLATGKEGRDKVGMAMSRRYRDRPHYSEAYLRALEIAGKTVPTIPDASIDGLWVELMLQIRAIAGREVSFSSLLDLAVYLRDVLKFDIVGLSYDGWQSVGEQQRAREKGFNCIEISMDKTNEPAERAKELLYAGMLNFYPHPTFLREAEELVYDKRDKVDHPETSNLREQEEGDRRGSKDVWDGVCGTGQGLLGAVDGSTSGDVDETMWARL